MSDFTLMYRYDPGDVAIIHPVASLTDLQAFLRVTGWEDIADVPFAVEQRMFGALRLASSLIIIH